MLAIGLDRHAVARRVARGSLHRVYHGVYAVGHTGLSREGRWLAAVLASGRGATLGLLSATELCEVRRRQASLIDVVVPRQRRAQRGIRLHTRRGLDPRDVTKYAASR